MEHQGDEAKRLWLIRRELHRQPRKPDRLIGETGQPLDVLLRPEGLRVLGAPSLEPPPAATGGGTQAEVEACRLLGALARGCGPSVDAAGEVGLPVRGRGGGWLFCCGRGGAGRGWWWCGWLEHVCVVWWLSGS